MFSIGDIAHNSAEQPLIGKFDFAHSKFNGKRRPVLPLSNHIPPNADDLFLARSLIVANVVIMLTMVGVRHQNLDIHPDDFVSCVAEDSLGGRIEGLNDSPFIDGDNSINGGVHNGTGSGFVLL